MVTKLSTLTRYYRFNVYFILSRNAAFYVKYRLYKCNPMNPFFNFTNYTKTYSNYE